jgi:hypothetical protein
VLYFGMLRLGIHYKLLFSFATKLFA